MIRFVTGDLFKADVEALVNTVNCVGVMGRGVALQFKNIFPKNFKEYKAACDQGELNPGVMFVTKTGFMTNPKLIINFPTKRHWKGASRIGDIALGLEDLVRVVREKNIKSLALPPLGSGLGGLDWTLVKSLISEALEPLTDIDIFVYEPRVAEAVPENVKPRTVPPMTPGRASLVLLVDRYLKGLLDPNVTLLEIHKLMYFMQISGENLKLRYSKGHYGPYAENLRHVLRAIEGYYLVGYSDGGDAPEKPLSLVPGAYEEAKSYISKHDEVLSRIDSVAHLVEGFEAPTGLELLATVHWVIKHENVQKLEDVVEQVHRWNDRKSRFTPRQIGVAFNTIAQHDWLH